MLSARSAHHAAMRRYRFHTPDVEGSLITVTGDEARHAATVLRLKPGDEVDLFDGQGTEVTGIIQSIESESMIVAVRFQRRMWPNSPLASTSLILATSIPKGARADWMIEKCAELGVSELRPVHFERSVVDPGAGKLDRWRRLAMSAAKQCGSATVMTITESMSLNQLLDSRGRSACVFGHPQMAGTLADQLQEIGRGVARFEPVIVVIGPEGGLSTDEFLRLNKAGATPVRWAQTVLRVETAAIAAAAVFASHAAGFALHER